MNWINVNNELRYICCKTMWSAFSFSNDRDLYKSLVIQL